MTDLERRLVDLGHHLDVPAGQHLAAAVTERLASTPAPDGRRRRWRRWAAGAVIVGVGAGAAPALADWFGIGGVAVHRDAAPTLPAGPSDRGRAVAPGDVVGLVGFTPILPAALGAPDQAWVDDRGASPVVWLAWDGGPLLTELQTARTDGPVMEKYAASAAVEEVRVGRHRGLWVEGRHEVALDIGEDPDPSARYTADGTLLVEIGSVTVRIETPEGRDEALRIARSLPGT